jgi:hypothetical protein
MYQESRSSEDDAHVVHAKVCEEKKEYDEKKRA